jgi:hypothetical protein
MRTIYTAFIIIAIFVFFTQSVQSQTPLYLNIVTHNEDNEPDTVYAFYIQNRTRVVQFVNMIASKNAKLNFQSDWKFPRGVLLFDTGSVLSNTNGKNILRWIKEDMNMEVDAHAHEQNHNYADVAYLHILTGVQLSRNIGGFIYNQIIMGNNWENMEDSLQGRKYPFFWWNPEVLWGAGTPNHVADPYAYGIYKPKSMADFFTHDSTKKLILIGKGCDYKIWDTTQVTNVMNKLRAIMNAIQNNAIPDTGMFAASIFLSQGDFNSVMTNKISTLIDSIAPYVATGKIIWSNLSNTASIWKASYLRKPMRVECSQVSVGISYESEFVTGYELKQNYPNPFNPTTNIEYSIPEPSFVNLSIYDINGKLIETAINQQQSSGKYLISFNFANYSSGVYFYKLTAADFSEIKKMVLIK